MLGEIKPAHQSSIMKAEQAKDREQGESDFAYTIAAARRSEQRRLLNFIRMSDYMICDTLHTVLLESVRDVLSATQPEPISEEEQASLDEAAPAKDEVDGIDNLDDEAASAAAKSKSKRSNALFEVELLLDTHTGEITFDPAPDNYQTQMSEILTSYLSSLCTLSRLYGDETLLDTVMGDKASEVEPCTELQELVTSESYDELVGQVAESLDTAFAAAEQHTEMYYPYRDMLLEDHLLDIPALAPAFKDKDNIPEEEPQPDSECRCQQGYDMGSPYECRSMGMRVVPWVHKSIDSCLQC